MRDVRRVAVPSSSTELSVHVVRADVWRIADEEIEGFTAERKLELPALCDSSILEVLAPEASGASGSVTMTEGGDIDGTVPFWEWCRIVKPDTSLALQQSNWGIYTEE